MENKNRQQRYNSTTTLQFVQVVEKVQFFNSKCRFLKTFSKIIKWIRKLPSTDKQQLYSQKDMLRRNRIVLLCSSNCFAWEIFSPLSKHETPSKILDCKINAVRLFQLDFAKTDGTLQFSIFDRFLIENPVFIWVFFYFRSATRISFFYFRSKI